MTLRRSHVAAALRQLGHEFVDHELTSEQLETLDEHVQSMRSVLSNAAPRVRTLPTSLDDFAMAVPKDGDHVAHQLFADSIVSGGDNPLGLAAELWRESDTAVMKVTLGSAFEGAPGRSHGGVVAALIDETMGLVLAIHRQLAFTGQLDISYHAPTPVREEIVARASLDRHEGRKLHLVAHVHCGDVLVASATALFISVDPAQFLARETPDS